MPERNQTRNKKIADSLHSAAIRLLRSLRRVDADSGMTAPRLSVLSILVFGGSRTLGELAEAEQVRPPTMTKLIRALEAGRLVRRVSDKSDRRVAHIHATTKGKAVMLAGRERRVTDLARRLNSLPAQELRELERAAKTILKISTA